MSRLYQSYVFSRAMGGNKIPQRVQNLVIRTYAQKKNLNIGLSATEYAMENSYMMLKDLLKEGGESGGIIFYSLNQLPDETGERTGFLNSILGQKKELHFALEEFVVASPKDLEILEDMIRVKSIRWVSEDLQQAVEEMENR